MDEDEDDRSHRRRLRDDSSERSFMAWARRYAWFGAFLAGVWLGGVTVALGVGGLAWSLTTVYCLVTLVASGAAFVLYGTDKAFAQRGDRRRIAENALHAVGLAGGWPGALLAQQMFRHKTSKPAFQLRSWLIVACHVVVVSVVLLLGLVTWT